MVMAVSVIFLMKMAYPLVCFGLPGTYIALSLNKQNIIKQITRVSVYKIANASIIMLLLFVIGA